MGGFDGSIFYYLDSSPGQGLFRIAHNQSSNLISSLYIVAVKIEIHRSTLPFSMHSFSIQPQHNQLSNKATAFVYALSFVHHHGVPQNANLSHPCPHNHPILSLSALRLLSGA